MKDIDLRVFTVKENSDLIIGHSNITDLGNNIPFYPVD